MGNSVNATNISGRKLGDCDFQDGATRRIVAYESHGGTLTDVYIREHLRTLRKVVPLRKLELESVAAIQEWDVTVHFFAHNLDANQPETISIEGLRINFLLSTFAELLEAVVVDDSVIASLGAWFLPPLRARRTPDDVRIKVLGYIA